MHRNDTVCGVSSSGQLMSSVAQPMLKQCCSDVARQMCWQGHSTWHHQYVPSGTQIQWALAHHASMRNGVLWWYCRSSLPWHALHRAVWPACQPCAKARVALVGPFACTCSLTARATSGQLAARMRCHLHQSLCRRRRNQAQRTEDAWLIPRACTISSGFPSVCPVFWNAARQETLGSGRAISELL